MQDPQSLHKYAYVHGDPIGNIDPTGRSSFSLGGALTGMAVMGTAGALAGASIGAVNGTIGVLQGQITAREAFAQIGYGAFYGAVLGSIAGFIMGGFVVGLASLPVLGLAAGPTIIAAFIASRYAPALFSGNADEALAAAPFPGPSASTFNFEIPFRYKNVIEQTANQHDIPPLLLTSVLMYEVYQYNEFDVVSDFAMLEFSRPFQKRSIGMTQLRIDNLRKVFPQYRAMENVDLRELLLDPQTAIPILGQVVGHMRDGWTSPGELLHVTQASWSSMSNEEKENVVRAYAGAKDNLRNGEPWDPHGAEHPAAQRYGVEKGYRNWKNVDGLFWE